MVSLLTTTKAQTTLAANVRAMRVNMGLTQAGLAKRSGVTLPTLRKFEQKGLISLESFLKLLMVLGMLDKLVTATNIEPVNFSSIDEVLQKGKKPPRKKGWRT